MKDKTGTAVLNNNAAPVGNVDVYIGLVEAGCVLVRERVAVRTLLCDPEKCHITEGG